MTQTEERQSAVFSELYTARTANSRVQRKGGCTGLELNFCRHNRPDLPLGIGVAEAANPTLLAETGGFLLGNAHRCGVAVECVERAETVIHDLIVATTRDFERGGGCGFALYRDFPGERSPQTKTRTRFRPAQW